MEILSCDSNAKFKSRGLVCSPSFVLLSAPCVSSRTRFSRARSPSLTITATTACAIQSLAVDKTC